MCPSPLSILLVSDGKPGHEALSLGIVAAIARLRAVAVTRVAVKRPGWLPPRAVAALTNARSHLAARLLGLDLSAIEDGFDAAPDLVVSAGGDTLAANVSAARRFGCRNIFYGSLRRYRPSDFTLVLTSYAEHATRPNVVMALKPSALDPDTIPTPPHDAPGRPPNIGLLVGGDSGTVRFTGPDWDALIGLCERGNPQTFCLTVANSRRTPNAVSDRFAELAHHRRIGFIDVRTAGPGTLGPLFAASDAILATIDSSSMISEAVWARRPVVVLTPATSSLPELEARYRRYLEDNRWTAELPLGGATAAGILDALAAVRPLATNPQADLATLLAERLSLDA